MTRVNTQPSNTLSHIVTMRSNHSMTLQSSHCWFYQACRISRIKSDRASNAMVDVDLSFISPPDTAPTHYLAASLSVERQFPEPNTNINPLIIAGRGLRGKTTPLGLRFPAWRKAMKSTTQSLMVNVWDARFDGIYVSLPMQQDELKLQCVVTRQQVHG